MPCAGGTCPLRGTHVYRARVLDASLALTGSPFPPSPRTQPARGARSRRPSRSLQDWEQRVRTAAVSGFRAVEGRWHLCAVGPGAARWFDLTTLTVCIPDRYPHLAELQAARSALRASTKPALARWVFGAVLALRVPRWSAPTAHSSHGPPRLVPAACHAQSACNNCAGGYYQGSKGQTSCHQVRPVCVLSREQVGDV